MNKENEPMPKDDFEAYMLSYYFDIWLPVESGLPKEPKKEPKKDGEKEKV